MNKESEEILLSVRRKYRQATNPTDKIVVKWIGWLAVFLSMDTIDRIDFAANDDEVNITKARLTKDIYGIRNKSREMGTATNTGTVSNSSPSTRSILRKDTSKNIETNKTLSRRRRKT